MLTVGQALGVLHVLTHPISKVLLTITVVLILKIMKLRSRDVHEIAQGCTVRAGAGIGKCGAQIQV